MALRLPRLFNIHSDPFETADHSMEYWRWTAEHVFLLVPGQQYVEQFLATFKEFPPRQKAGSFSLDLVLDRSRRLRRTERHRLRHNPMIDIPMEGKPRGAAPWLTYFKSC